MQLIYLQFLNDRKQERRRKSMNHLMTHSLEIARHPTSIDWFHFWKRQVRVPSTYALVDWQLATNAILLVTNIAWKVYVEKQPLQKLSAVTMSSQTRGFCSVEMSTDCTSWYIFHFSGATCFELACEKKSGVLPKKKLNEADFQSEVFFSFQINFSILLCDCFRQQLMRRPENFGRQYNSLSENFSSSALENQS